MSLFSELNRRNVLRVATAYVVTSWLLIQVAETIFPLFGFGDGPARMVVIVLAVGFVPVLILAWAFEWTPEGIKKDSEVDRSQPVATAAGKKLDRVIMIVLALALGYFAFDKFVVSKSREAAIAEQAREEGRTEALVESYGDQSIAVLPFVNMSSDPEQEYFGDGLAEEILNLLARLEELRVISRSSSFSFKGKGLEIPDIANQLNVAHVLEGSVRKAGNQIRVTAQLIEARSDTHLWSQTWDRTLDDIFAIQDEIATHVVEELHLQLVGAMPTTTRIDPDAYAQFLQAVQMTHLRGNRQAQRRAGELLEQVLAVEPDYIPAMEKQFFTLSYAPLSDEELAQQRNDLIVRILALEPDNVFARTTRSWSIFGDEQDIPKALDAFAKLVTEAPQNTDVLVYAGALLRFTGHFAESRRVLEHCMKIDPLNLTCMWQLKESHLWDGQLKQALELTEKLRAIWGRPGLVHDALLQLLLDNPDRAIEIVKENPANAGIDYPTMLTALALLQRGDRAGFEAGMADVMALEGPRIPYITAQGFALAGEADRAFEALERALDSPHTDTFRDILSPWFWNLHDDPRWEPYLEKLGRKAEWNDIPLPEFRLPN